MDRRNFVRSSTLATSGILLATAATPSLAHNAVKIAAPWFIGFFCRPCRCAVVFRLFWNSRRSFWKLRSGA